jgi:hypothetical protein
MSHILTVQNKPQPAKLALLMFHLLSDGTFWHVSVLLSVGSGTLEERESNHSWRHILFKFLLILKFLRAVIGPGPYSVVAECSKQTSFGVAVVSVNRKIPAE